MIHVRQTFLCHPLVPIALICLTLSAMGHAPFTTSATVSHKKSIGDSLFYQTYFSAGQSSNPKLVFVLHGDAPFNNPGYQYQFAKRMATSTSNTIVVAILRPGYTDAEGNRSQGVRGLTTGDNYTKSAIDAIASTIDQVARRYHPQQVFLVGHSGGAALTADIMSLHHELINNAVMVSCPCDLSAWRAHMKQLQNNNPIWDKPVESISPLDVTDKTNSRAKFLIISGMLDDVAPTIYSQEYFDKLRHHNVEASLVKLPGLGHEIFLEDSVCKVISSFIRGH